MMQSSTVINSISKASDMEGRNDAFRDPLLVWELNPQSKNEY